MICDYCKNQIKECLANVTIKNFPKKNSFCNTNCMYKYQEKLKSEFVQIKREDLEKLILYYYNPNDEFDDECKNKYLKKGG